MRRRPPKFKAFALRVLERKKLKSPKTYQGAELHMRKLVDFFGDKELKEVNEDAWIQYCVWRRRGNPTCRLFDDRKHLISVMLAAYREAYLPRQLQFSVVDEKRDAGREISDEELGRIYQFANPEMTLQIDIALKMGMRYREMLYLRWERIEWGQGLIRLSPRETKTRRGRVIPLPGELLVRLKARHAQAKSLFVFPGRDNLDRPRQTNALTWRRILRKAGVKARWHDLRHTCATRMLRRGVPPHVVRALLGMGLKVLMEIYAHQSTDDLRKAVEG